MGFFSLKATCALCGKEIGLNRFMIGRTLDGEEIWKCPACTRKGGLIKVDYKTGKAWFIDDKDTEVRMKCRTCGYIYCYTANDLLKSQQMAKDALRSSLIGVGEVLGGTSIGAQMATNRADDKLNQITDYTKCPHCNSTNVVKLSDKEWEAEQKALNQPSSSTVSEADELLKFKELLDSGVITQEEFDAKKKQILGL